MKKLLICMVMATMAVCANAQITWNVRAGAGIQQAPDSDYDYETETEFSPSLIIETNIPFAKSSSFTFSPAVSAAYNLDDDITASALLHFGYKIPIAQNTLFCPKIGPMLGFQSTEGDFLFGPSIELPFEINRIVIAANANVSLADPDETFFGAYLTVGYKF